MVLITGFHQLIMALTAKIFQANTDSFEIHVPKLLDTTIIAAEMFLSYFYRDSCFQTHTLMRCSEIAFYSHPLRCSSLWLYLVIDTENLDYCRIRGRRNFGN